MDLGYNKLDKSGIPNLNAIFNEGDVSMMDEMNRLVSGFNTRNRDSHPPSKSGSDKTKTRKMSPIENNVNALDRPRLSDEKYSHLNFKSPTSNLPTAGDNLTPARNTLIKTFNMDHLDIEDDFVLGGKITPLKERALGTTAFGMVADNISRIQGTEGHEGL